MNDTPFLTQWVILTLEKCLGCHSVFTTGTVHYCLERRPR